MPRKAKSSSAKPTSKSEFIRARLNLSPKETLAEAKSQGLKISPAMVYSIRSEAKKRGSAKGKPGRKPKAAVVTSSGRGAGNGSLEDVIRSIVKDEIKRFFAER